MAVIDCYRHQQLGWIRCDVQRPPSGYNPVGELAIYRLLEDPDAADFRAKAGDLLVGGGGGEWGYFRLSASAGVRCALRYSREWEWQRPKLFQAYWDWEMAYALCGGFERVGWVYPEDIEIWLAERVANFAVSAFPQFFPDLVPVSSAWQGIIRPDFAEKGIGYGDPLPPAPG